MSASIEHAGLSMALLFAGKHGCNPGLNLGSNHRNQMRFWEDMSGVIVVETFYVILCLHVLVCMWLSERKSGATFHEYGRYCKCSKHVQA
jgi:hypothetical protein